MSIREAVGMTVYSQEFYESQADGSSRSAEIMVPMVVELLEPDSVIDVGCGVGTWLEAYRACGIKDILGLDGDYVDREKLRVNPAEFKATDLTGEFNIDRTFDLVQSLEVAEHLDRVFAEEFVARLVELGPVILFSAAVPYQLGTRHMNEQFLPYWRDLFERHDYRLVDCFRPRVWSNENVEVCYRQNAVLFAASGAIEGNPALRLEYENSNKMMCSVIHPELYKPRMDRVLNTVFETARQLHQQGQLQQAEPLYRSILDFNPHAAAVWDAHGQLAAQANDLKVAAASFTRAVESEPGNATYHFNLGQVYLMGSRYSDAKGCFRKALDIRPGYQEARKALEALQ